MSGILGWFGGGAAQKQRDSPKNVIIDLRSKLEMLEKREKYLQTQIDAQVEIAKNNVTSNKKAAMAALKRKKLHEHNLEQTLNHIGAIEQQISAIEAANINQEAYIAMERAKVAMKQIHGKLTPGKVDETMDQLQEYNRINMEIGEAMSAIAIGEQPDEEELIQELEELQQQELDDKMRNDTVPVLLPTVANGEIKGKATAAEEDDEEAELRKLQAEMAM
ncbi:ESCRT-III subunit protein snf7 [Madurella fahalii]|uniref:Vacuolar-sorting protein SNF7 n=1 Tax=Madurella fahalii TaxID=1157608 RepID=A0ABQ0G8D9_9PEZI